jgi:hypothetical protein
LFDAQEPHISDGLTSSSSKLREAQLPSEAGTVTGRR